MDFSSIWNTGTIVVSAVSALLGGAIGMFIRGIDARQKFEQLRRELRKAQDEQQAREAATLRAARDAAAGLEAFAHDCIALLTENARAARDIDTIQFELPHLIHAAGAGNRPEALMLESAYRDLQRQIASANQHIDETFRDGHDTGWREALRVLEARAYETAAAALALAGRYRKHFKVPRTPLGRREQQIEDEILARAAEQDAASTTCH
ncbi:hypothetical protein [Burkholderia anthina]|uniref:hypothetical protein n=1 Tax=Burkholderia anthina TaxID=179879 RepID=UPI001589368F|nr:hypothetical protein [Burkholderia anthina]